MLHLKILQRSQFLAPTHGLILFMAEMLCAGGAMAGESLKNSPALFDSTEVEQTYLGSTDAKICEKVLQMSLPQEEFPMFPIQHWKINYETLDTKGERTNVSGLYSLPAGVSVSDPWLVYQHGTKIDRNDVPSRLNGEGLSAACHFGILKLHILQPDYIGLGDSLLTHPFLHAASETSVAIDLFEAMTHDKTYEQLQEPVKVIATGYSQGGHASMALHRELEKQTEMNLNQKFKVVAAVHMAGPYDLSQTTLQATLSNPQPVSSSLYTSYLVTAYQDVYHDIYSNPTELFLENFTGIPDLFRSQQAEPILRLLPALPQDLFKQEFLKALMNQGPNDPSLKRRLAENDVYHFAPEAPTLLIYAGADRVVAPMNALVAAKEMNDRIAQTQTNRNRPYGSQFRNSAKEVTTLNVGDTLDHSSGAPKSFEAARKFISQTLHQSF